MNSERYESIDMIKGFAIICLILSHCQTDIEDPLKIWIFAWHMPVFFVVSGFLHAKRHSNGIEWSCLKKWFKHRFIQLFVPYIFWGVVCSLFYLTLSVISGNNGNVMEYIYRLITLRGIDSMWFIPIFFVAEFLFSFIILKCKIYLNIVYIASVIILLYYLLNNNDATSFGHNIVFILTVLTSIIFMCVGNIYTYIGDKLVKRSKILLVILFLLGTILSQYNGFVRINLEFANLWLYFTSSILLCVTLLGIFEILSMYKNRIFEIFCLFGRNSIMILCTNQLLIESFRLIEYKCLNNVFLDNGDVGAMVFALIISYIEYIIIEKMPQGLKWVFGK